MTTLTLPIVIGKKYVRRDGAVVEAKAPPETISDGLRDTVVCVGTESDGAGLDGETLAWKESGRINCFAVDAALDLVADYVEPVAEPVAVAVLNARIPAPTGHRHAAQMLEYAQDAAAHAEPWKLWEKRTEQDDKWIKLSTSPVWSLGHEYRRTPKCIVINGHEVPVPLRVAPENGSVVWVAGPGVEGFAHSYRWDSLSLFSIALKRGQVHATMEAAAAHGRALASFTTTEVAE